jgi:hypothetical protein
MSGEILTIDQPPLENENQSPSFFDGDLAACLSF